MDKLDALEQFCCWQRASRFRISPPLSACLEGTSCDGDDDFSNTDAMDYSIFRDQGVPLSFPPEAAVHIVKLACQMPDLCGRSICLWDCEEIRKQLIQDNIVSSISAETIRRILQHHKLKPWRVHFWLGEKTPRDEQFYQQVSWLCELYTRPVQPNEIILCFDEKTSLQPRMRLRPTLPAKPETPVLVEHEYKRNGALNLFAAFDTRTGKVYGKCFHRKRAKEFIGYLDWLDQQLSANIEQVHIVLDNLRAHKTKAVQEWLAKHPRFKMHFLPVHCSWMNQAEQWFSILQRKRFKITDFNSLEQMEQKIMDFIEQYNQQAHPFNWTTKSVAKVMAMRPATGIAA